MIRKDLEEHYEKIVEDVIENNKNLKCLKTRNERHEIIAIKDDKNTEIRDRDEILRTTAKICTLPK